MRFSALKGYACCMLEYAGGMSREQCAAVGSGVFRITGGIPRVCCSSADTAPREIALYRQRIGIPYVPLAAPKRNAVNGKRSKGFRTGVEATAGFVFRMRMKVSDGPGTISSASAFKTPIAVQPRSRRDWSPFVSGVTPEMQPV
jgi:hypothetical protein